MAVELRSTIAVVALAACRPEPLQHHAERPRHRPAAQRLGCEAPPPDERYPAFPLVDVALRGDTTGVAPVQNGLPAGGAALDHKCSRLAELITRGRDAATAADCTALAAIDHEVCQIDPQFLVNVYVRRIDGDRCRSRAEAIHNCTTALGPDPS